MRGYSDLGYFKELDFMESLSCYIHLVRDFENELTVENLTMLLSAAFGGKKNENSEMSEVDEFF